ncbi:MULTISPECIES: hypothetical protein [unclassified Mesorhizobium]|uniref:hypothetical protein n=1 Tax=unclassified Mesorhizobium TaxID=325217 RepID=UPI0013DF14ED|nr:MULTISPECIES: hypothetical protein [unclassified Mesorhizobium]
MTPGDGPVSLDLLFDQDFDALPKRMIGRPPELIVGNAGADCGLVGPGYKTASF